MFEGLRLIPQRERVLYDSIILYHIVSQIICFMILYYIYIYIYTYRGDDRARTVWASRPRVVCSHLPRGLSTDTPRAPT